jgi:hypothetical protein
MMTIVHHDFSVQVNCVLFRKLHHTNFKIQLEFSIFIKKDGEYVNFGMGIMKNMIFFY